MTPGPEIAIFVLAGGKSSRMGRDKGRVLLNGKPMIAHVLETLQELELPINIIANDASYEQFGYPVFRDVVKEKGPMGGMLTAFENTTADVVFLVSCDMPFITTEVAKILMKSASQDEIVAALVGERIHPLFALYPVELKKSVKDLISEGNLKMTDFILKNKHTLVPSGFWKSDGIFRNINTQQELNEAEEQWNYLK
ncbi:putative molybdenum cofactor guanylyltransferase [Salinimicrobium marinum]|uniref:Probable molybdenum cofactor guanylyltransferase n=1 Tax=Salinimicrobium marinum TaxID=680283 RepID=A0A918SLA4_9FLAO|nr:molybdenum cofactor guanylyltransferase [Salinimicrobium marinum]GHA49502.1 putative molybdenum cofactor guanylyltransferase [Salinimicrobium marinum]